jgi:hypothetical protein
MRERLGLILEQQRRDIAARCLLLEQLQPQPAAGDGSHILPARERVPRPTPAQPPFSTITTRNHDADIFGPARCATSSLNRGTVHTTPVGGGSDKIASTTGSAAAALTPVRPRLG